ncbi:hypothetical protein NDU88_002893 [Pleurodeles waltl]|uniref:Uncharacterized protein n=1 Tax=Pleurodeles waltl TaxID=8319 RepID=A0AAV7VBV5_PLEWA|nr:hypothetical protein NDU88_002893 [Pleurodeles waltl]
MGVLQPGLAEIRKLLKGSIDDMRDLLQAELAPVLARLAAIVCFIENFKHPVESHTQTPSSALPPASDKEKAKVVILQAL